MFLLVAGELLDALFLRKFANEKSAILFSHDITIKSLNNNFLLLCGVYNAIVRLVERHILSYHAISVKVCLGLGEE